jgi:hypothetical protein
VQGELCAGGWAAITGALTGGFGVSFLTLSPTRIAIDSGSNTNLAGTAIKLTSIGFRLLFQMVFRFALLQSPFPSW